MATAAPNSTDFETARRAMIDSQLRTSGVNEPWVLARFASVPREDFVPQEARAAAYTDRAVRLDNDGVLASPLFHARLLSEARPTHADSVLVVDGGSGYLPALLEGLARSVAVLSPAEVFSGSGAGGYSVLLVDGAAEHLPDQLVERLAEGARVATGIVDDGVSRLAIGRKTSGAVALLPLAEMGIPRIAAFDRPKAWTF
ncbi:protein-L-isoaspartate O-methyltransferase [Tsuneonella deserti]|uniref:Protein-L-isoaspartate O-methyltransferase n=1 Tax=Tsuneonella deserti TaxID=2035528 RepID=A0ABQ1SD73_9SPHN|nr:protein-L-isoaspartate O-methyltransferase [Tsuneonella deserti]GGE04114.1 protein-L-isoaspartate O-methyltransferase [Tsuneonella deserti]